MIPLFWLLPLIQVLAIVTGEAIRCYNCYSDLGHSKSLPPVFNRPSPAWAPHDFIQCNNENPTASNLWSCPIPNSHCITQTLELASSKSKLIWRSCSNGPLDPCETNPYFSNVNVIECNTCKFDKCNMHLKAPPQIKPSKPEPMPEAEFTTNKPYTLNINANINLYIRK